MNKSRCFKVGDTVILAGPEGYVGTVTLVTSSDPERALYMVEGPEICYQFAPENLVPHTTNPIAYIPKIA